jgi:hypothetical protein
MEQQQQHDRAEDNASQHEHEISDSLIGRSSEDDLSTIALETDGSYEDNLERIYSADECLKTGSSSSRNVGQRGLKLSCSEGDTREIPSRTTSSKNVFGDLNNDFNDFSMLLHEGIAAITANTLFSSPFPGKSALPITIAPAAPVAKTTKAVPAIIRKASRPPPIEPEPPDESPLVEKNVLSSRSSDLKYSHSSNFKSLNGPPIEISPETSLLAYSREYQRRNASRNKVENSNSSSFSKSKSGQTKHCYFFSPRQQAGRIFDLLPRPQTCLPWLPETMSSMVPMAQACRQSSHDQFLCQPESPARN